MGEFSLHTYYQTYEPSIPGVTIEWVDLASQDYNIKASTMLSGGDTTDVARMWIESKGDVFDESMREIIQEVKKDVMINPDNTETL